jgi:phage terminase large subunit-like protein
VVTAGDCHFDVAIADRVVGFFPEYLTHIEGQLAGKPFVLEPWQQAIVGCAFGWKRPNGTRRYREIFQYVPRKNGKSTQLGGLINMVAFCDDEPGAQIYSAAAEREQAALVYRQAKGMILNKPELAELVKIFATFKSIEYPGGNVYKALSADADTKHGFNTHFVVVDELHAQSNRNLVDVLVTSTGSRRQPMVWYITTADFDRESICNEKYTYACTVRDNGGDSSKPGYDPSFLPAIFEASIEDDWKDPKTWRKANPNLGVSISEEYLERECKRAQETPTYENTFKRLHLNVRTQNDMKWLDLHKWDASAGETKWKELAEELKGRECIGGLDLAATGDLNALCLLFRGEGAYKAVWRFWMPENAAVKRERKTRIPFRTWANQGLITLTDGDETDYSSIRRDINDLCDIYPIRELAVDRLFQGAQLSQDLIRDGMNVITFGMGFMSMTAPTKELERLVNRGEFHHGGNPVVRWMAGNTAAETDSAGNIKPSKAKSTEKIDGVVAAIMALGRAMVSEEETSVYQNRGILVL